MENTYSTLLYWMQMGRDLDVVKKKLDEVLGGEGGEGEIEREMGELVMRLWVFSAAYKVFGDAAYLEHVKKMIQRVDGSSEEGRGFEKALSGVAFLMAFRWAGISEAREKGMKVFEQLKNSQTDLDDWAAFLFLASCAYEENFEGKEILAEILEKLETFYHDGKWYLSNGEVASLVDGPILPSVASLAEAAQYRARQILEKKEPAIEPLKHENFVGADFHNLYVELTNGKNHELHVLEKLEWSDLPLNVLQMPGKIYLDCFNKMCRMFKSKEDLIQALKV